MEVLDQHIEALIFAAEHNVTDKEIKATLDSTLDDSIKNKDIQAALERLKSKFDQEGFSFELVKINNGYTFMTKSMYHDTIGNHLKKINKKKLSKAALETLAMIAYKQPVTKVEVESIRGVNCDYVVQKLLEKELIEIGGRSDAPGRPLIYKTSAKFMDYFGISDVSDLPKPKDFAMPESEIGEPAPIEEDVANTTQIEEANPGPVALESSTDAPLSQINESGDNPENTKDVTAQESLDNDLGEIVSQRDREDKDENVATIQDHEDSNHDQDTSSTYAIEVEDNAENNANAIDDLPPKEQVKSSEPDEDLSNNDDINSHEPSEEVKDLHTASDVAVDEEKQDLDDQIDSKSVSKYIEAEKSKLNNSDSKPFTIYASESGAEESANLEDSHKEEE